MGYRSLDKCSGTADTGGVRAHSGRAVFSPEIVQGIYRYTRIAGAVYSVYRETTKKYIGLALYDGKEFHECGSDVLVQALKDDRRETRQKDESKNRK